MSKARVIIADNHDSVLDVLTNLLGLLDIEAVACRSGEQVLQLVAKKQVDAVISDVEMPLMGGMDLAAELQARKPGLPVIMMSSYASDAMQEEALQHGALGLLAKPFKLESVTAMLARAGVEFLKPA
jgi:DNA-binding NtrC family response regulator